MKRLLTLFIATLIISGCSKPNPSDDNLNEEDLSELEVEQTEALDAAFSDNRLDGMLGIVENEFLQLYVDEATASIAVVNKKNDEIWYSNPPDKEKDPIASGVNSDYLSAQMNLSFFNRLGQKSSMNSYSDSIVHQQFSIHPLENGIRVKYQFGSTARSAKDLPLMLSATRFTELSGKLDSTGQRALLIGYIENPETGIYERNDGALTGMQLERTFTAFEDAGYTEEDLEKDMAELNFTQENDDARVFLATIEYTLEEETLSVRVPTDDLYFDEEFPVDRISFLRFFGAAGVNDKGSIFVPDGSGALIHFNNGKTKHPAYQQSVYGQDVALLQEDSTNNEETVRLPVFGLIKNDSALLGIIEEGASVAIISADVSGRNNNYNTVYPTFNVINTDNVTLQAEDQVRSLSRFQEKKMNTDFVVRYVFLEGEDANYTAMARYYQNYLVKTDQLRNNRSPISEDIPFYLQLIGGINKQQHFAGIPYQSIEPLTTFEQAETVVDQLLKKDISNIKLNYLGWFNQGVNHSLPTNIKVEKSLGGEKGFKQFMAYTESKGISVFPETAMLQVHNERKFKPKSEASRKLTNIPAAVYPINSALGTLDNEKNPSYALSPRLVEESTADFIDAYLPYETTGVALRDLADLLNSDFRRNEQIDRTESETISTDALAMIYDQGIAVMANGGNLYALPYLTDVMNVPLGTTDFKIVDEAVPFYQTVLRGYVDYASRPFNMSTYLDYKDYILKTLEYGSNISFQWIYESNDKLKNTDFDHFYSVNYEQWLEQAADIYQEVNETLKKVKDEPIERHEKLADDVYRTEYENGISVIVNYSLEDFIHDGVTIAPQGYSVGGD